MTFTESYRTAPYHKYCLCANVVLSSCVLCVGHAQMSIYRCVILQYHLFLWP